MGEFKPRSQNARKRNMNPVRNNIHDLTTSSRTMIGQIHKLLYEQATVYLPRKLERFHLYNLSLSEAILSKELG